MIEHVNILAADTIERSLEFANVPAGWSGVLGVVVLSVCLLAAGLLYRFEQRAGAPPRVRGSLAALRCTVILLLAAIWMEPVLATYIHRRNEAWTLVLVDGSASMGLQDRYRDPADAERVSAVLAGAETGGAPNITRWDLARTVLNADGGRLLNDLAESNPVQLYRFGDSLQPLGQATPTSQPNAGTTGPPDAPASDIGRAVRGAVESLGGKPVAGIVVLSDGRFNRGEPVEVVGRYARDKRIPIYTVGIGDASPPRNAAIGGVEAPSNVFVEDPFKITAHVRAEGLDGETLVVELLERRPGEEAVRSLERRSVPVPAGGQPAPIVFSHQIAESAEKTLIARVLPREDETLTDDNSREVTVRALANRMRVLLVAGAPSWEYRYLARLLERDATIDVSCWLQSADEDAVRDGNTVIDHFPREPDELRAYDCIVLIDPEPDDFDPGWTSRVEEHITNDGSGLLYVAGRKNTPRFAHHPNPQTLLELLPVAIDPGEADLILNELGHFQRVAWAVSVPPAVANHPVLAMSDDPRDSAEIWAKLDGVYWHYPVRREKPVATVLLRHANPAMRNAYGNHVLLATQFVGSGRTGFLGFDSTWRWRRYGDEYFNRFWIQLLRHLVEGKLLGGQRRGFIQVERDRTGVGEAVMVEARLLDARYQPLEQPDVRAAVSVDGEAVDTIHLAAQPNRPGWFRGQLIPTRIGTHALQIDLPADDGAPVAVRGEIRVGRPDLEFRNTTLDRESLTLLAERSAGGRFLHIDEAARLPSLIPSKTTTLVLTGQPVSLWDRWWTFAILVGLLGIEWALRKRFHLL